MSNRKLVEYAGAIAVGIVLAQFVIYGGLSLTHMIAVILAGAVILAAVRVTVQRWRFAWSIRYNKIVARVQAGDFAAVHDELMRRYDQGDRPIEVLTGLVLTHNRLGRWRETRPFADALRAYVEQRGLCARADLSSRARCDLALLAQADVLIAHGRYADAAHSLRPRVPDSATPNYLTAIIAWCFFLAEDGYNASVVLEHVKPVENMRDREQYIMPDYQLMIAYMRRVLNGDDTRAEIAALSDCVPRWDDEIARYADSPYGPRLSAILDGLRPLLPRTEA